ncbi:hypothetical protein GALL_552300 [mine drainage metagenome]|uniref:Uncharacterized protein n=1 Tax=mine drainage metagenome TaxID=410659 RepID=A0A1J5NWV4_9ZZZZ
MMLLGLNQFPLSTEEGRDGFAERGIVPRRIQSGRDGGRASIDRGLALFGPLGLPAFRHGHPRSVRLNQATCAASRTCRASAGEPASVNR